MTVDYENALENFVNIVKHRQKDQCIIAMIIDSPWLPGYMGVDTLDFYFDQNIWLSAYTKVMEDLPGVAFIPGTWVEFGMAAEPSGWGANIQWYHDSPPSVQPLFGGISAVLDKGVPDPEKDGLMPIILRQYELLKPELKSRGILSKMAATRGPLAIASHLVGVTEFLMASQLETEKTEKLIEKITELCILWLKSQIQRLDSPVGILVLDDIAGMLSPNDAERFVFPYLKKIFLSFPGLIHIFHNDTPNEKIFPGLASTGIDILNFSNKIEIAVARQMLGNDIVLMGNIPPLEILVRGSTEDVKKFTQKIIFLNNRYGPIIISPGGGVSPGTPIENLQAISEAFN